MAKSRKFYFYSAPQNDMIWYMYIWRTLYSIWASELKKKKYWTLTLRVWTDGKWNKTLGFHDIISLQLIFHVLWDAEQTHRHKQKRSRVKIVFLTTELNVCLRYWLSGLTYKYHNRQLSLCSLPWLCTRDTDTNTLTRTHNSFTFVPTLYFFSLQKETLYESLRCFPPSTWMAWHHAATQWPL